MKYLIEYSGVAIRNTQKTKLHIFKLKILEDDTYCAVIKTFWIRIIQRHWKKIFQQRKIIIQMRCSIKSLFYNQINGKHKPELKYLPTINGMLSMYSRQ